MRHLLLLLSLPLLGQTPHFTVREAIQAELARQPLSWTETQKAALPSADRARLERTLMRIGAPGTPALLPPELEKPTLEAWEAKAKDARTPQERVDALFFLNRLKSPKALTALMGLGPANAAAWPRHLHLDAQIATARLNGGEVTPALQAFLDALQKAGKVDPVRAQAARLRLVMAGKEKELLPAVPATPGSVLALMDAWNRGPWDPRAVTHLQMMEFMKCDPYFEREQQPTTLGFARSGRASREAADLGLSQRLLEGSAGKAGSASLRTVEIVLHPKNPLLVRIAALTAMSAWAGKAEDLRPLVERASIMLLNSEPLFDAAALTVFRKFAPETADLIRSKYLQGQDATARAAAIEDLPSAPADLAALTKRTWTDAQFESQQTLIQSYARWKMAPEAQKAQLRPWLAHPDWACRWEAYQALVKLDPSTPWPAAPAPAQVDKAILAEAVKLAERGKPVRLRITFSGKRRVTLRLDPTVAPMNVANLVLLARKGYFNGRLVPRVVPDFVVQMGSPYDTMDGGPGHTVRCENSLIWYGPGSVGMALSGKDTGGSQFFITTNATPHLTGKYTRMGEVEDLDHAMKVLDDLELGAKIVSIQVLNP
ncbi:MAG: peptidylprolyl isomerase [Holophagaceae bacterium]|nr:peptidylprolyl isomerase [Holophagaceae bacterium]